MCVERIEGCSQSLLFRVFFVVDLEPPVRSKQTWPGLRYLIDMLFSLQWLCILGVSNGFSALQGRRHDDEDKVVRSIGDHHQFVRFVHHTGDERLDSKQDCSNNAKPHRYVTSSCPLVASFSFDLSILCRGHHEPIGRRIMIQLLWPFKVLQDVCKGVCRLYIQLQRLQTVSAELPDKLGYFLPSKQR